MFTEHIPIYTKVQVIDFQIILRGVPAKPHKNQQNNQILCTLLYSNFKAVYFSDQRKASILTLKILRQNSLNLIS